MTKFTIRQSHQPVSQPKPSSPQPTPSLLQPKPSPPHPSPSVLQPKPCCPQTSPSVLQPNLSVGRAPLPAAVSQTALFSAAPPTLPRLFLGLDLGQRADHSALTLIERAEIPTGEFDHIHWRPVTNLTLTLRLIKHWPLGTPYLEIAAQTRDILLELRPKSQQSLAPVLALDASGPGTPVLELLRAARTGSQLQPVLITAGHRESLARDSTLNVPRELLLSQLRVLLERGRLTIPANLSSSGKLREELAALNHTRTGPHDDLAIALALAVNAALHFTPALRSSL